MSVDLAALAERILTRPRDNPVSMASTSLLVERVMAQATSQDRAVHHEAVLIRRLARRLHDWIFFAERKSYPITEATCCEWVKIMLDEERAYRMGVKRD